MELTKLHRERAVDAVYQALRQAILTNALKPGERLNVDELARKLGVSLTPVRGAIQQLATEGLVQIRPRSGTFVSSLTAADIDEAFEIRGALECLAAESAVNRLTPQEIKRLKELAKQIKRPIRNREDWDLHERNNAELHLVIVHASGNRRLEEIYASMEAQLKIARLLIPENAWSGRLQDEFGEHDALVEALEARDPHRVTQVLRKHIQHAKAGVLNALKHRVEQQQAAAH